MTDPEERPRPQNAFWDSAAAFLQRNAFSIALIAPIVVVSLLPIGAPDFLVVLVIYLGEAILYAAMRRGDAGSRGIRSGPGPGLQALYGVLATIFIFGGIIGLRSSGESVPIVPILAISLGIGIVAWVWHRVSRASGEDTTVLVTGMAGTVARPSGSCILSLVIRLILAAAVAGAAWLIAAVTKLFG